jgi:hypothetical protein
MTSFYRKLMTITCSLFLVGAVAMGAVAQSTATSKVSEAKKPAKTKKSDKSKDSKPAAPEKKH